MEKTRTITVRYLRTERFTNKNVDIKVQLYEMDMAIVDITVKTAYRYYIRLCNRMDLLWESSARFNYCKQEALWEYVQCLNLLRFDKVACSWLRRQRRKRTATLVCTNERMLALTRELVPDFYALLQRDRKLDFLRRGTPRRSES